MNVLLEALNRPAEAFRNRRKEIAWILVSVTVLINSIFVPILNQIGNGSGTGLDFEVMIKITILGYVSYLSICLLLFLISKCFGSKTLLKTYIETWGISYFPTVICAITVAFTEKFFYIFWNNSIWGVILNIIFGGILIWKLVLYGIYIKEVAGLRRGRFIGAFIIIGIFILILAYLNGYFGIYTPVL